MILPVTDRRAAIRFQVLQRPGTPAPFIPPELRDLPCEICGDWTEHRLSEEQDCYACTVCGFEIDYHINMAKPMYAIDLGDDHDKKEYNGRTRPHVPGEDRRPQDERGGAEEHVFQDQERLDREAV